MNSKMYYLITFGTAPVVDSETDDDGRECLPPDERDEEIETKIKVLKEGETVRINDDSFLGEISEFKYKREIDNYIQDNNIRMHSNLELAKQDIHQRADGRACMLVHGTLKGLRSAYAID